MTTFSNADSLTEALSEYREDKSIGFVPTMGALHDGHLALVVQALNENSCVVVSIFINPTQFDNNSDLVKYPRTLDADISLLSKLNGNILIYAPQVEEMYPNKITSKHFNYGGIEYEMEGKHRDGHFDGVGTIVSSLLNIVQPNTAYFGEKDFQQLQIIRKLVEIENIPVRIVGCPIVREANGLAKSSRNKRLTRKQSKEAVIISQTLQEVKQKFNVLSISELNELVKERFLNSNLKLEYFEIADEQNLKTAKRKIKNIKYRGFIAAFSGEIRLIDNMSLN